MREAGHAPGPGARLPQLPPAAVQTHGPMPPLRLRLAHGPRAPATRTPSPVRTSITASKHVSSWPCTTGHTVVIGKHTVQCHSRPDVMRARAGTVEWRNQLPPSQHRSMCPARPAPQVTQWRGHMPAHTQCRVTLGWLQNRAEAGTVESDKWVASRTSITGIEARIQLALHPRSHSRHRDTHSAVSL